MGFPSFFISHYVQNRKGNRDFDLGLIIIQMLNKKNNSKTFLPRQNILFNGAGFRITIPSAIQPRFCSFETWMMFCLENIFQESINQNDQLLKTALKEQEKAQGAQKKEFPEVLRALERKMAQTVNILTNHIDLTSSQQTFPEMPPPEAEDIEDYIPAFRGIISNEMMESCLEKIQNSPLVKTFLEQLYDMTPFLIMRDVLLAGTIAVGVNHIRQLFGFPPNHQKKVLGKILNRLCSSTSCFEVLSTNSCHASMSRSKEVRDHQIHHFWQNFAELVSDLLHDDGNDASESQTSSIESYSIDEDEEEELVRPQKKSKKIQKSSGYRR